MKPDLHEVESDALVELKRREVVLADGPRLRVPYVGPVVIRFRNRRCFTGAIPLEDMDVVVRPQLQSVDVNPESPNMAVSLAK